MNNPTPIVTVCVCTYKRPQLLESLLQSLSLQSTPLDSFEVVVVDNDGDASGRPAVERFQQGHTGLQIRYVQETRQGISYARNASVHHARGEFLAFIDDDETASAGWIESLLAVIHSGPFDAVMGPVIPVFPEGSADWAVRSGFFERRRHQDGARVSSDDGRTSNAMVRAEIAKRRVPFTFDPRFAKSGGEDHDFFKWVEAQGHSLGWADHAIVEEIVPKTRQTLSFMLERSFRQSAVYWRGKYQDLPSSKKWVEVAKGLAGSVAYGLVGSIGLLAGLDRAVRYWVKGAKGLGRLFALTRVNLEGY